MDELYLRYASISLFRGVSECIAPLAELILADTAVKRCQLAAAVFAAMESAGCDSTGEWIQKLVLSSDNVFSRTAASGERISPRLKAQAKTELETFRRLASLPPEAFMCDSNAEFFPRFGCGGFSITYDKLVKRYAADGCGVFALGNTFIYSSATRAFIPVADSGVRLSDLKNYAEEKSEIIKNTERFIAGLPAFNTLLYGDRGTGKSTTVRALAGEYVHSLKIIELKKSELDALPQLYAALSGLRQKYIVFIDDLSFDENDDRVDGFKAALEGSFAPCGNVLLYCTSNRRHLIKESIREVKNRNDETQAELALFDRFGLVVTYINPDKDEFIDILKQILSARGIKWRDEYASVAELSALKRGGRSPRAAKQIADLIEAAQGEAGAK